MTEIKPCPFCGGEASVHCNSGGWYWAQCQRTGCDAELAGAATEAEAIAAWNQRVPDPSVITGLREAREALAHIIGSANEAPKFGPFDQIDNTGQPYQSADFDAGLAKGRKALAHLDTLLAEDGS